MERCALVTGCSSGIGRETALAFREEEWDVVATARDEADIADLAERGCHTAELDVTDPDQITAVVEDAIASCGRIDCLVNNAGTSHVGPLEDITDDRLRHQFEVNVFGPHRLTRAVLPHMRERQNGTVINISSNLGRLSLPGAGAYAGSKFALEAMSDALRAEVEPFGIDVVVVQPGPVDTRFREEAGEKLERLDRTPAYAALYRVIDDWASLDGFDEVGLSPRQVADVIVNAGCATQPEPRYVVGTLSRLAVLGRYLPDRLRDAVYGAVIRITSYRRTE